MSTTGTTPAPTDSARSAEIHTGSKPAQAESTSSAGTGVRTPRGPVRSTTSPPRATPGAATSAVPSANASRATGSTPAATRYASSTTRTPENPRATR